MYVTTSYQPDINELARALHLMLRPTQVRAWWACGAATLAGVLHIAVTQEYTVAAICVLASAAGVVALRVTPKLTIRKMAARFLRPTQIVITEQSYRAETDLDKAEYSWQGFYKIEETPEFFLLYQSKRVVVTLPKRAFHPAQVAELSRFFQFLPTATNPARPIA